MKFEVIHRGKRRRIDGYVSGRRLRLSLGTANDATADAWKNKIERALHGGAESPLWPELKRFLPPQTFHTLAGIVGYQERQAAARPTWAELQAAFSAEMQQRITLGKLAESTRKRYKQTLRAFSEFLKETGATDLPLINRAFVERFKVWRLGKIRQKKFSRGGRGLMLDVAILHRVFAFALESEMIERNPVRLDGRPGDNPEGGAQPFTGEELKKLRDSAGEDLLAFQLFRWTGLRRSDAIALTGVKSTGRQRRSIASRRSEGSGCCCRSRRSYSSRWRRSGRAGSRRLRSASYCIRTRTILCPSNASTNG